MNADTVTDFLARGGKITYCPAKGAPENAMTVNFSPVAAEPTELDDVGRMVELAIKRHIGPY